MGWAAARKLRRAVDGLAHVLAGELLTASRALELRAPLHPAPAPGAALAAVRALGVAGPGPDRYLAPEIEAITDAVRAGSLVDAAQAAAGRPLN